MRRRIGIRISFFAIAGALFLASAVTAQQAPAPWQPPEVDYWPPFDGALAEPSLVAEAPLLEEELPGSESYWGWSYDWIKAVDWDGGVELGLNGSEGNSETMSLRSGLNLKRKTDINEMKTDLTYLKTTTAGVESQHNAIFNAGYERFLGDSPWTYFLKSGIEYDEFKAFDLRLILSGGWGYRWWRTDTLKFKTRIGTGVSREINGPDNAWAPEAVFGTDYEWQISDRQKLSSTVDYYPQWSDFNNYRIVTDAGWEVLLDEVANLSLKLSVKDRYDSTPNGRRPNDVDYAVLLLWKL
ncbi:MAG: YdiY family protein [Pirellulaceae bacterium]